MSDKSIIEKIEQLATDPGVKECLLELVDFEQGSESGRSFKSEYKMLLQKHLPSGQSSASGGAQ
ncbi:MAG: hypothetical protein Q7W51_08870 [Coriobacteriia bacterium]|nr:hypothetical protein [Coriobacteriia bacterium]